ncbi:hypothetical protein D3C81_1031670 [compost metagenome]
MQRHAVGCQFVESLPEQCHVAIGKLRTLAGQQARQRLGILALENALQRAAKLDELAGHAASTVKQDRKTQCRHISDLRQATLAAGLSSDSSSQQRLGVSRCSIQRQTQWLAIKGQVVPQVVLAQAQPFPVTEHHPVDLRQELAFPRRSGLPQHGLDPTSGRGRPGGVA